MKSIDDVFTETIAATQIFIVEDHFNNLNQQLNKKSCCDTFLKDANFLIIYWKEVIKYHFISLKVQPFWIGIGQ